MSYGPFARVIPYSSIVGSSVTVHGEPDGPAFMQLAILGVNDALPPGDTHRSRSEALAKMVADAINQYGQMGPKK